MKNYNLNLKTDIKKRSYLFALDIIAFIEILPKNQTNNIIINQLLRSATSIGANIIEAQASSSKKDFINFYHHSLKSANETKFWLCLLRDSKKSDYNKTQKLLNEVIELANILGSSILTMKGKK
ncbi:MAG: hypothetical protein ACD_58C00316G0006 [uncultured bacterium]|nr:MAG: hypothetical protein ACD_58C00316G0006 [uncultured bacterium]